MQLTKQQEAEQRRRVKEAKERLALAQQKFVYKHPQQQEYEDKIQSTTELLDELTNHSLDTIRQVNKYESDMRMCEALQKTDKPGSKIEEYLKVWSREKAFDEADQLKFIQELWKTKEQFE